MKSILRSVLGVLVGLLACLHAVAGSAAQPAYLSATAGAAFDADPVYVAMLEARAEVIEHLSLAVAAVYLDAAGAHAEGQLRLMAVGSWNVRRWAIENRHLLSFSTGSIERYRIRLRATKPGLLKFHSLSLRAFDEVFLDVDQQRLIRNNVALGAGLQLNSAVTAELYRVWEANRYAPDDRYVLGLVTVRF